MTSNWQPILPDIVLLKAGRGKRIWACHCDMNLKGGGGWHKRYRWLPRRQPITASNQYFCHTSSGQFNPALQERHCTESLLSMCQTKHNVQTTNNISRSTVVPVGLHFMYVHTAYTLTLSTGQLRKSVRQLVLGCWWLSTPSVLTVTWVT